MTRRITRREFVKRTAGSAMAIGAALTFGTSGGSASQAGLPNTADLSKASKPGAPAIEKGTLFFDPHQYALVAVLSGLIMPEDESPGAAQAGVADFIDRHLAKAGADEQGIYRQGLQWMDDISRRSHGKGFLDLQAREQESLLHRIGEMVAINSMQVKGFGQRLKRKILRTWYEIFDFMDENIRFFIWLRRHVIYAFYASPMSWEDIGYFGPPQPVGYLDFSNPPTSDNYTGKVRPVENKSCLICHPAGNHPRGKLIDHTCQVCHRPHSPWPYAKDAFHVEDHIEMAFPNLDRRKRD